MLRKLILVSLVGLVLCLGAYELARWRQSIVSQETHVAEEHGVARSSDVRESGRGHTKRDLLPTLDANGFTGIREITRPELVKLMTANRPLSLDENANLNRGCPGLACVYQGLGLRRWPESARGTVAYLRREHAVNRRCPNDQENFIFLKQGCWLGDNPPIPDPITGEVSLESVVRVKPGLYTFNYAVYFPSTATYAWMNHRDFGFPLNRIRPQKAYLSALPPPLDNETRPAQIYCSTCR